MKISLVLNVGILGIVGLSTVLSARASNGTWLGTTSTWELNSNWSGATYPGTAVTDIAIFGTGGNATPTMGANSLTVKGITYSGSSDYTITGAGSSLTTLTIDPNNASTASYITYTAGSSTIQKFSGLNLNLSDSNTSGQAKFLIGGGKTISIESSAKLTIGAGNNLLVERSGGTGDAVLSINGALEVGTGVEMEVDATGSVINLNFSSGTGLGNLTTFVGRSNSGGVINFQASGDYGAGLSYVGSQGGQYNVAASGITIQNRTLSFNSAAGTNRGQTGTLGATYASGTSVYAGTIVLADPQTVSKTNTFDVTSAAARLEISNQMSGGDSSLLIVSKTGSGVLALTNASGNTFLASAVNVSAGTLLANNTSNSATSSAAVNVASGAALGGTGRISGVTTVSGAITPGDGGIGTLTVANDLIWNGGASAGSDTDWKFELGPSNTADKLDLTGAGSDFLKGTGSAFRFNFQGSSAIGTFVLVDWAGATTFSVSDFSYTNLSGGVTGTFQFNGSQLEFVTVPEPETWLLVLAAGLTCLFRIRRRRA